MGNKETTIYLVGLWDIESNVIIAAYIHEQDAIKHKFLLEKERIDNTPIEKDFFFDYCDEASEDRGEDGKRIFKDYKGYTAAQWEKSYRYHIYNEYKDGEFYIDTIPLRAECTFTESDYPHYDALHNDEKP